MRFPLDVDALKTAVTGSSEKQRPVDRDRLPVGPSMSIPPIQCSNMTNLHINLEKAEREIVQNSMQAEKSDEKARKTKHPIEFGILKIAVSQWGAVISMDKVLQAREIYELSGHLAPMSMVTQSGSHA